jgi:hypothetical protein
MPGRRHSRLLVTLLLLLSLTLITLRPSCAQDSGDTSVSPSKSNLASSPSSSPGDRPTHHSNEITTVGCIGNNNHFFTDSSDYALVGNDDEIAHHGGDWVRVRGKPIPQTEDGPANLQVLSISTVSKSRAPTLDAALRDPSSWQNYSSDAQGVRLAFPKDFDPVTSQNDGVFYLRPGFIKNDNVVDVHRSEIRATIYVARPYLGKKRTHLQLENPPFTDFHGGAFAVYVNPQITDAATCKQFAPELYDGKISSRRINGINYTAINTYDVGAGSGEEFDTFHTFQNGRCFEVDFQMGWNGSGAVDITCAMEDADGDALETLLVSKISFFRPKSAAAATVH